MASLELKNIIKDFGETRVIHGVDLQVNDGEFVVFVGPSGCGKSTLLRMICGLEQASSGDIHLDGVRVVVAADTEDAVDREALGSAADRQRLDGGRRRPLRPPGRRRADREPD